MKISQTPTNHILVIARTNSDLDTCNFAIITCDEKWKERLKSQIEFTSLVDKNGDLASIRYYDGSTSFYTSQNDEVEELLSTQGEDKQWAFVELKKNEQATFTVPENCLEACMISIDRWGSGRYVAYGKHTSEEFYTETIPFNEILKNYESLPKSDNPWRCTECGSKNVMSRMWVGLNDDSEEMCSDGEEEDNVCNDCGIHGDIMLERELVESWWNDLDTEGKEIIVGVKFEMIQSDNPSLADEEIEKLVDEKCEQYWKKLTMEEKYQKWFGEHQSEV